MGKRREARERAIQFLFQYDLNPPEDLDQALRAFWETQRAAALAPESAKAKWGEEAPLPAPTTADLTVQQFADPLIRGTPAIPIDKSALTQALWLFTVSPRDYLEDGTTHCKANLTIDDVAFY